MVNKARALIVDAEPAFRAQLRDALDTHLDVVAELPDAAEGVAFAAAEPVDLIVMSLPRGEDFEAARELLEHDPDLVLVLLNRPVADEPTTPGARPLARGASELHGLAKMLVALGSLPRRPAECRAV